MPESRLDKTALKIAIAYFALILWLWSVYVSTFYPFVINNRNVAERIFLNELIRFTIFVIPVFLLLKFVSGENPFRFLKLQTNVFRGILWGIIAGAAYAALVLLRVIVFSGTGGINPKPVPVEAWFTSITVSTLIEEIAFRGFLLQNFERTLRFRWANAVTAVLFVAVHFPGWIIVGGSLLYPDKLLPMAEILFLGLLLGYIFKRTDSLWSSFILHAANNLMSIILFR